jgi:hypothetical protein
MFCTNCGTEFEDSNSFCPNCGTPVTDQIPVPIPAPAPDSFPVQSYAPQAKPQYQPQLQPQFQTQQLPPIRPLPPIQPVPQSQPVKASSTPSQGDPAAAKSCLITGILAIALACTMVLSIVGIVLGFIGLGKAGRFRDKYNAYPAKVRVSKYLSIGGIVFGFIYILLLIYYIFYFAGISEAMNSIDMFSNLSL